MAQEFAVTPDKPELPGYWRFAWMFFMQPVTLHRWLKACGIEEPDMSGLVILIEGGGGKNDHIHLRRLFFLLWGLLPFFVSATGLIGMLLGLEIDWIRLVGGMVLGAALGGVFCAVGIMDGVAFGVIFGIAFGVAFGVAGRGSGGVALAVVFGVAFGVLYSVVQTLSHGTFIKWVGGVFVSGSSAMLVVAIVGSMGGNPDFMAFVAASLSAMLIYFRVPFYFLEAALQSLLYLAGGNLPEHTLRYSPILFHDLSYLPHPFLSRHIVAAAKNAPELVKKVIDAAAIAPGQQAAAKRALAELQAMELAELARTGKFALAAELQGRWLSGQETANPLHRGFADAARFVLAADGASSAHIRLQHLEAALNQVQNLDKRLTAEGTKLDITLRDTLAVWRNEVETRLQAARSDASRALPNPYTAGNPLSPDMKWDPAVFRGREDTVRQVEALLADSRSAASLALIGPRRCGKTSLLNMLPVMLPDTLVVVFDLQANPVSSPLAFYQALARRAREQALRERRLELPVLPEGAPIEALGLWLEALEHFSAAQRILICIDEFERLESLFPGEPRDLLQFMGLMRATIQHRRRVRLLVSGAAPSDEMGPLWNDHFINLREIRIGFLDEPTTVALLTKPVAEFPDGVISPQLAQQVFRRSGGQPYLTQLFGWLLVDRLNVDERRVATLDDLAPVEEKILDEANGYFSNIWDDATPAERDVLTALAQGHSPGMDESCRRRLARRLIAKDGSLAVPVFGHWLRERRL